MKIPAACRSLPRSAQLPGLRILLWMLLGGVLLAPAPGVACPVCRPKVQAAIHTVDYAATLTLLLLPAVLLLGVGLALYWAESLRFRRRAPAPSPQPA